MPLSRMDRTISLSWRTSSPLSPAAGSSSSSSRGRGGHGPGDLDAPLDAVGQRLRAPRRRSRRARTGRGAPAACAAQSPVAAQHADRPQQRTASCAAVRLRSSATRMFSSTVSCAEQPQVLERPGHARAGQPVRARWPVMSAAARTSHVPDGRPVEAADHVEQRGLARAVGPDDAADLAGADRQRDVVERLEPAEVLGDPGRSRRMAARPGAGVGAASYGWNGLQLARRSPDRPPPATARADPAGQAGEAGRREDDHQHDHRRRSRAARTSRSRPAPRGPGTARPRRPRSRAGSAGRR